ncbi:MAG: nucleotidyltransferase family protein [Salinivenus sp.]
MSRGPLELEATSAASGDADPEVESIKRRLREALPHLRETYAVEQLYLHGSRLRGEAGPESDLDVLVDFQDSEAGRAVSLLDFVALKQELEDLLGVDVDLGERTALHGPAGDAIQREAEPV